MIAPRPNSLLVVACAAFAAGAAAVALLGFGPLDPPNGPISPTYKTLSEVEPRVAINAANTPGDAYTKFKITKPGSYYLTGNLTGVSGKTGIEVADNIRCTIDLGGFELTGVNGSLDGILLTNGFRGAVRNGQIVGWGGDGIDGVGCNSSRFEDLSINGCVGTGIYIGRDSVLSRVQATSNQADGITVDGYCTLVDCVASGNAQGGINAGSFSTVSRSNAHDNGGPGILGVAGLNISDSVSVSNGDYGIAAGGGVVRDNVCDANPTANILIYNAGGAIVRNNTCSNSDGSGISCSSGSNQVEANLLQSNLFGLHVESNGHTLLTKNYCVGNTQAYYIANGNNFAEFLDNPGGGFVSYNTWANFSN